MNNLILVNKDNRIDARSLHGFLEVGKHFKDWMTDKIDRYDFIEGIDYYPFLGDRPISGGRSTKEYLITISMAKELCMVANSTKGKEARLYFIECEKRALQPKQLSREDILKLALQAEAELKEAEKKLAVQAPNLEAYNTMANMSGVIAARDVANMLRLKGVNAHKIHLWLVDKGYYYVDAGRYRPYKKYIENGYFTEKIYTDKEKNKAYAHYYFTPKGVSLVVESKDEIEQFFNARRAA